MIQWPFSWLWKSPKVLVCSCHHHIDLGEAVQHVDPGRQPLYNIIIIFIMLNCTCTYRLLETFLNSKLFVPAATHLQCSLRYRRAYRSGYTWDPFNLGPPRLGRLTDTKCNLSRTSGLPMLHIRQV